MKLSVCIPVYNYDVSLLVKNLQKEIVENSLHAEIILIDDASEKKFSDLNQNLQADRYIALEKNIGRSAIRNLFLKYASGDYLLFLDCDAELMSPDFLQCYLTFLQKHPWAKVVYGGRKPAAQRPQSKFLLRWKYAQERESLPLEKRMLNPYITFQTHNFLISKDTLEQFSFSEELKGYGYEDVLFALELKKNEVPLAHLDNPVRNGDLESNAKFLNKTKQAVANLSILYDHLPTSLSNTLKILRVYRKLKSYFLEKVFLQLFLLSKNAIHSILLRHASLFLLDVYRLGLFLEYRKNKG